MRALVLLVVASGIVLRGEAADLLRQVQVSERLWDNFVAHYAKVSLEPLARADLDLKGREAMLGVLGVRYRGWKPDKAPSVPEMLEKVLAADPKVNPFDLMERTLTELLPRIDLYGRYESMEEMEQMQEAARQSRGVFALNLVVDKNKLLRCFPDPDGPASKAGVLAGAQLLEVDGASMFQKSLAFAKMAFVGGKSVQVKVRQPQGREETITIERTFESFPPVSAQKTAGGLRVRIRAFDEGVARQLRGVFQDNQPVNRLTLDVRGNGGGLVQEALTVAAMFFPEGTVLGHVRNKEGEKTHRDPDGVLVTPNNIQVLIDQGTASAAEFLAVCLRENLPEKAVLHGTRSYGKSHTTLRSALTGGGMLTLTDGILLAPSKETWDKTGLKPDVDTGK